MTTFELGKKYYTRFACDYDSILTAEILERTAKTVLVKIGSEEPKRKKLFTFHGAKIEAFYTARYSMAPIFSADKPC